MCAFESIQTYSGVCFSFSLRGFFFRLVRVSSWAFQLSALFQVLFPVFSAYWHCLFTAVIVVWHNWNYIFTISNKRWFMKLCIFKKNHFQQMFQNYVCSEQCYSNAIVYIFLWYKEFFFLIKRIKSIDTSAINFEILVFLVLISMCFNFF